MNPTGPGINQPKNTAASTPTQKTELTQMGYRDRFFHYFTAPVATKEIDPERVKAPRVPQNGAWSGILQDITNYMIAEMAGIDSKVLMDDVSSIAEKVLVALAKIQVKENAAEEERTGLDDPDFGKLLLSNILTNFLSLDLSKFNPDDPDETKKLSEDLDQLFDTIMRNANLSEANKENLEVGLREALYPSNTTSALKWIAGVFVSIPGITYKELRHTFRETLLELCNVYKMLEKKSVDSTFVETPGATKLAQDLVEKILAILKSGELAFDFPFLRNEKNKEFLTKEINSLLAGRKNQNEAPKVPDSESPEDDDVINKAWHAIKTLLETSIKAILSIVLASEQGESPKQRLNQLIDGFLKKLHKHSKNCSDKANKINELTKKELLKALKEVPEQFNREAETLSKRSACTWEEEAQQLCKEAWGITEPLSREELKTHLEKSEEKHASNPKSKISHSNQAKALLERFDLTWEQEAQHLLKTIAYSELAGRVLKKELSEEKFQELFLSFLPAKSVFSQIHHVVGEFFLNIGELLPRLKKEGNEAREDIEQAGIPELPGFIAGLLDSTIASLESKGADKDGGFDVGYGFLNDALSHLLEKTAEGQPEGASKTAIKSEIKSAIENILLIVISDTLKKHTPENGSPRQAFDSILKKLASNTQLGIKGVTDFTKAFAGFSLEEQRETLKTFAKEMRLKVKIDDQDEKQLSEQYTSLLLKQFSRELLNELLPKETFNKLLPDMAKKWDLWEMIADDQITPYLMGFYEKSAALASEALSEENNNLKLTSNRNEIMPLVDSLVTIFGDFLSEIKLSKLLMPADENGSGINFSILDKLFGESLKKAPTPAASAPHADALEEVEKAKTDASSASEEESSVETADKKEGMVQKLIRSALPTIIESLLAHHLNPKAGEKVESKAAQLILNILTSAQRCYQQADAVKGDWDDIDPNTFGTSEEYKSSEGTLALLAVSKSEIKEYLSQKKLPASHAFTREDYKQCYIWTQTDKALKKGITELLDLLLPKEFWVNRVPEQFSQLISRENIGDLLLDTLRKGYKDSASLKATADEGEKLASAEELHKGKGLKSFVESKVKSLIENALKEPEAGNEAIKDSESVAWAKKVFRTLMNLEKGNKEQPVYSMAINITYGILGNLLSGNLSTLSSVDKLSQSLSLTDSLHSADPAEKNSGLIKKMAPVLPKMQTIFHYLNAPENEEHNVQYSSLSLEKFLSVEGHPLKEGNSLGEIPVKPVKSTKGEYVLEVYIRDASGKDPQKIEVSIRKFLYWELVHSALSDIFPDEAWEKLIGALLNNVITKEFIASLAIPYVEGLHKIQEPLQQKAEAGRNLITASKDPEGDALENFIREKIINAIKESLGNLAKDEKPLADDLPEFLDKLIKELLGANSSEEVETFRNTLIERGVYLIFSELLVGGGEEASATNVNDKLVAIVEAYNAYSADPQRLAAGVSGGTIVSASSVVQPVGGEKPQAPSPTTLLTQKILDQFLPEDTWNKIVTGTFADLFTRNDLIKILDAYVMEIVNKIPAIQKKEKEAKKRIEELDAKAGLPHSEEGGLAKMVKTICDSIDETLDDYSIEEGKIFATQPLLINSIAKAAFKDKALSGVIKESVHALVNIVVARTFAGEKPERQVMKLLGSLIKSYNRDEPAATTKAWLELMLPEDLRKELLPKFLQDVITHEFLADLLAEYVQQIAPVIDNLAKARATVAEGNQDDAKKLKSFLMGTLTSFADPNTAKKGISGYGGQLAPLENEIFQALRGGFAPDDALNQVGRTIETVLEQCVDQFLGSEQGAKLLDRNFLSEAVKKALPMLSSQSLEDFPQDFALLNEQQLDNIGEQSLKKLKIDLVQQNGETAEHFKKRIQNRHFELQSADLLAATLFPEGLKSLPVPEVAQESLWNQIRIVIADQLGSIYNRDKRVLFALKQFGTDEKTLQALEEKNGNLNNIDKAESAFNNGLVSFAMKTVDSVFADWPQPFRWLVSSIAKTVVWIALKLAINKQVWAFVSASETDVKMRHFTWTLLSFAKDYESKELSEEDKKIKQIELSTSVQEAFTGMGLLKGLRGRIAPLVAGALMSKNFVDFLPITKAQ